MSPFVKVSVTSFIFNRQGNDKEKTQKHAICMQFYRLCFNLNTQSTFADQSCTYEVSNAIQMNSGSVYNTPRDYDDRRLH